MSTETWEPRRLAMEMLSYVVTIVGFPFAILVFYWEQRKERDNEEEEIYQKLADEYADFLKLILDHADLHLRSTVAVELDAQQKERKTILFDLLVSLFERAYILAYEEDMTEAQRRRWQSWEDWISEWCRRADFRRNLPMLLQGEDQQFVEYITSLCKKIEPGFTIAAA